MTRIELASANSAMANYIEVPRSRNVPVMLELLQDEASNLRV
jgi:hypothetical protein